MPRIPTMTRLNPELRKLVDDIAKEKNWTTSFAVAKIIESFFSDKNKEVTSP